MDNFRETAPKCIYHEAKTSICKHLVDLHLCTIWTHVSFLSRESVVQGATVLKLQRKCQQLETLYDQGPPHQDNLKVVSFGNTEQNNK